MTTTIVCGIDSSAPAAAAARKAAELASGLGARLYLISAYGKNDAETVTVGTDEILVSAEQEAVRVTGAVAVDLRAEFPGLEVVTSAAEGKPADALVRTAEKLDAAVIVVGNKRVQSLGRILGSVASDVAAHAPCDVYVAHTHA